MHFFVNFLKRLPFLLKILLVLMLLLITMVILLQIIKNIKNIKNMSEQQKASSFPATQAQPNLARQTVKVEKVIDGDTVQITGGQLVRYIGIDAPEMENSACFSSESYLKNKELVENQMIELEKDISDKDQYGRLLRYVYKEGWLINEVLVRQGFAVYSPFPPDIKYKEIIGQAEREARAENLGIWKICPCFAKDNCQKMLDCSEAKYYLENCGKSEFDQDGDGIPCEDLCL